MAKFTFALANKVVKGKRPKIPKSVPTKMAKLIKRCWRQVAEDRPSFDEIFKKLSSDISMLGENVDEDEIRDYIDMLYEQEQEKEKEQKKESEELIIVKLKEEMNNLEEKYHNLEFEKQYKESSYLEDIERLKAANDKLTKELVSLQTLQILLHVYRFLLPAAGS